MTRPARRNPPARDRSVSTGRLLRTASLLLVLALPGLAPVRASAQVTDLVSSLDGTTPGNLDLNMYAVARLFTTGPAANGYNIDSAVLDFHQANGSTATITVTIRNDNSGDPGSTVHATLTRSSNVIGFAENTFRIQGSARLAANTTYWIMAEQPGGSVQATQARWYMTPQATASAFGWQLGAAKSFDYRGTSWTGISPNLPAFAIRGTVASGPNNAATGLALGGTAKVGETLTADTSNISDADGLTSPTWTYQWARVDADGSSNLENITGANSATYTLTAAEQGRRVRVTVSFTDDNGNAESLATVSGVIAAADNNPATGLTISGTEKVDEVLTAVIGSIADPDGLAGAAHTYQWTRVGSDGSSNPTVISGATSQTYTLVRADSGRRVRVTVRFTDAKGNPEAVDATSGVIAARDNVAATGLAVSGTEKVHEVLTADTAAITDGNGLTGAAYTYRWARVDADGTSNLATISGATARTYTTVDADLNRRLRVTVQFTDDDGHAEALDATSGVIAAPDNVAATGLTVRGRAMVRRTLTARTGGIRDGNGLTRVAYTYQWARVDADGTSNPETITGATSATYTMADADLGKRMRVTVSFTDDDGYAEALTVTSRVVVEFRPVDEDRVVAGTLTRFGNVTAGHVLAGVQQRFDAPHAQGVQTAFAGQHIAWGRDLGAWNPDGGTVMDGLHALTTRSGTDLLAGSSLLLSEENAGGGYTSVWARGAYGSYAGKDGAINLEGSVRTGQIGADRSSGPWLLGVSIAHSTGDSDYAAEGETGTTTTTLNGVWPYVRYRFTERDSLWVAAGRGTGSLTLAPAGGEDPVETDIGLTMGAIGVQVGMAGERDAADDLDLALNLDAAYVRMTSEAAADRLSASSPDSSRVRVGLEGSRRIVLENGATLVPAAELGVRRDGGSLSPGTGVYVGADLAYTDPAQGLSFDVRGHSLLAHQASGTREWGISGAVRYDADRRTGTGLSWALDSGFGAVPAGGMGALFTADTIRELEGADDSDPGERLKLEVGYGMPAFGNRFISRPAATLDVAESGSAWRLGWQLASAPAAPLHIRSGVSVAPRNGEYTVGLLVSARF